MTTTPDHIDQSVTIRVAGPDDLAALARLAQLDSAPPLGEERNLVAEVDGELLAALPLEGNRHAIANPFRHTAGIVALLEARAAGLVGTAQPVPWRRRLFGAPRSARAEALG